MSYCLDPNPGHPTSYCNLQVGHKAGHSDGVASWGPTTQLTSAQRRAVERVEDLRGLIPDYDVIGLLIAHEATALERAADAVEREARLGGKDARLYLLAAEIRAMKESL